MSSPPTTNMQQKGAQPSRSSSRNHGITYEDVKKAAEKLTREDVRVTLRAVRAELGTGSLSTLQRHLSALRSLQTPMQTDEPSPLAPQVLRALAAEVDRAVLERTKQLTGDLQDAGAALELLVNENEMLRDSAAETAEVLEQTRASLAEQAGTAEALRVQVANLSEQLAKSRSESEAARQDIAVTREQLHAADGRAVQLDNELRAARQELVEFRQALTDSRQETSTARHMTAALQAELASRQQVEDYLKDSAAGSQRQQQQLEETRLRLAAVEVERKSLGERVDELKASLSRAEEYAQQLVQKLLSDSVHTNETTGARP